MRAVFAISIVLWAACRMSEPPAASTSPPAAPRPANVTPPKPDAEATIKHTPSSLNLAMYARQFLTDPPRGFRDDCSGYVESVMTAAGFPIYGSVADMWRRATDMGAVHHNPMPHIGDLAFFDNTWDRNGNARRDDRKTHIAVVVDVEPDGTIVLAHRGSSRRLIRMNLLHPFDRRSDDGDEWNSWLRQKDMTPGWPLHLTGQLWAGFATIPERSDWGGRQGRPGWHGG